MRTLSVATALILSVSATLLGTVVSEAQTTPLQPTSPQTPSFEAGLPPPWLDAWTGLAVSNNFVGSYFGAVRALNASNNLWTDGFVLRWEGIVGRYTVKPATGTNFDVDLHGGAMMFGYRTVLGAGSLTAYIGPDYQNHNTPDPGARVRDLDVGLKGLVEYYTPLGPNAFFYGQGYYTGAFDSYAAFGQLGYQLWNKIWVGPEAALFGNEAPYRESRLGAFIKFEPAWAPLAQISVSGGYRNPSTSGSADGYYIHMYLGYEFR